jgi:hypothetical protein
MDLCNECTCVEQQRGAGGVAGGMDGACYTLRLCPECQEQTSRNHIYVEVFDMSGLLF